MTESMARLARKQSWSLLLLFVVLFAVIEAIVHIDQQSHVQKQQRDLAIAASQIRAGLETEVNTPLQLSSGLVSYISAREGQVQPAELDMLLLNLVRQGRHIRNMGVAPGNRISHIYPKLGNEAALGLYYPDIPAQWPAVKAVMETRRAMLTGPIVLKQGGEALVFRIPVFLPNGRYWGLISTVLNNESIWQLLRRQATELGVQVALRTTHDHVMLDGDPELFNQDSVVMDINVVGSHWQLAAYYPSGQEYSANWLRMIGWLIAAVVMLLLLGMMRSQRDALRSNIQLRQQEQYAQIVLDKVADAILVVNETEQIETVNEAAQHLLGYNHGQLIGLPVRIVFAQVPTSEDTECQVIRKNGEICWVEISRNTLELLNQTMQVLVLRDITVRRQTEQLKNNFVATVSHELRTPLTSIHAGIGLVRSGTLGPLLEPQQQLLDIAQQNSDQLLSLINDLLDIEKLTAGKMQFDVMWQPLVPLLEGAVQQATEAAEMRHVHVQLLHQLPANLLVEIDAQRWYQVLANLLSNAVRFSPTDGVVTLQATLFSNKVRIEVTDQGPGVPAFFIPQLFHRFAQVDSSSSRHQGGTGLGLAICKEILERMNTEIHYQTADSGGACFYFDLVFKQLDEE